MSEKTESAQGSKFSRKEFRDHMRSARKEARKSMEAWLPQGYLEHRRLARKEMLLAIRSLIDSAIEHLES
jgi:hypothetical protein